MKLLVEFDWDRSCEFPVSWNSPDPYYDWICLLNFMIRTNSTSSISCSIWGLLDREGIVWFIKLEEWVKNWKWKSLVLDECIEIGRHICPLISPYCRSFWETHTVQWAKKNPIEPFFSGVIWICFQASISSVLLCKIFYSLCTSRLHPDIDQAFYGSGLIRRPQHTR